MEIEKDVFEKVLDALGAGHTREPLPRARPDGQPEQRRATRFVMSAQVALAPHGVLSAKPKLVGMRSLSRSGAAVLDDVARHAGDKLLLYLPRSKDSSSAPSDGKGHENAIPIVCMVMNTRLLSNGQFRIGVQFLNRTEQTGAPMLRGADGLISRPETSATEILDAIAAGAKTLATTTDDKSAAKPAQAGKGAGKEKGSSEARGQVARQDRVELNVEGICCSYSEGRTGPLNLLTVKDISLDGGICVVQPEPMQRGEQFMLQIPRKEGKPLLLICTAVGCRRLEDNTFRIGARYESRLSPEGNQASRAGWFGRLRRLFGRKAA
jgi:hypothetical protein